MVGDSAPSASSVPAAATDLAPGPLTVWRNVSIRSREPVDGDSVGVVAQVGQARRLAAYVVADGPREAYRKATTRRAGVGQHGGQLRVRFEAKAMVDPDGSVAAGRWAGEAVGQVLDHDGQTELISWHYRLTTAIHGDTRQGADNDSNNDRGAADRAPTRPASGHIALVGAGAYMHNIVVPSLLAAGANEFTVTDASRVRAQALAAAINAKPGRNQRRDPGATVHIAEGPADVVTRARDFAGVVIACAHSRHGRYATAALASGGRVLVEKPASTTEADLAALVAALADATNIAAPPATLHVGHNRRFARDRVALNTSEWPRYFAADIEGFPLGDLHWYLAPGEGGRTLGNLTHWLDLALMVFDERPPVRVRAEPLSGLGVAVSLDYGDAGRADVRLCDVGPRVMGGRERLTLRTRSQTTIVDDWSRVSEMTANRHRARRRRRDRGHRSMYRSWFDSLALSSAGDASAASGPVDPLADASALGELVRAHHLAFVVRDALANSPGQWVEVVNPRAQQPLR